MIHPTESISHLKCVKVYLCDNNILPIFASQWYFGNKGTKIPFHLKVNIYPYTFDNEVKDVRIF